MISSLIFSVVEIKQLGRGLGRTLSVRYEGEYENSGQSVDSYNGAGDPPARYTLHAVLPYDPDTSQLKIGQQFLLAPRASQIQDIEKINSTGIHVPAEQYKMARTMVHPVLRNPK